MTCTCHDAVHDNRVPLACHNHCTHPNYRTQTMPADARRRVSRAPHAIKTPTSGTHLPRHDLIIYFILLLNVYRTAASQIVFPVSGGTGSVTAQMSLYQDADYANQHSGIPVLKSKDMLYAQVSCSSDYMLSAFSRLECGYWKEPVFWFSWILSKRKWGVDQLTRLLQVRSSNILTENTWIW